MIDYLFYPIAQLTSQLIDLNLFSLNVTVIAPAATGAFGAPAPAAGGFGQVQQQQTQTGSTVAPYQATAQQDGSNQIVLQAITAMPQYDQKSFEELRLEDHLAGKKGTKEQAAPAAAGGFGGFGAAPGKLRDCIIIVSSHYIHLIISFSFSSCLWPTCTCHSLRRSSCAGSRWFVWCTCW